MTFLRSDIGLGFGERAGTPPLRIPRVPPGGWGFKLFVLRILRCNAPFLVPGFSGKKQRRPSVFWKAARHWGRGWAEKMGWLYPSSVNSRQIIRLKSVEKVRRIIRPNWTTAFFTLEMDYSSETDNPSSKSVKIDGKQMDKVRRIVHAKLRPFHFQITTYYLSDANYPTDNSSQTDNPSPVRKRQLSFNTAPNEFHALTQNGQFLNIHLPLISYCTLR